MTMEQRTSDLDLVERVLKGDDGAFNELVSRYLKKIYYTSFRITRNESDAEDVTQEAFARAYKKLKSFRRDSGFYTWIYRIAVNLSLNLIKKRSRIQTMLRQQQSKQVQKPGQLDAMVNHEQNSQLLDAVARLPDKQRMTITLRILEELSTRETAEVMNCSEGTVKANLHFALRTLKKELKGI